MARGRGDELRDDGFECGLRDLLHFVVGPVLDGVFDEDRWRTEPDGTSLNLGGVGELHGGDVEPRDTHPLKIRHVMHTARRTAPSIRESFDDGRALLGDLLSQVEWGGLRKGRLRVAPHQRALLAEMFLQPVEKQVAPGLLDIEQAHAETVETRGPLKRWTLGRGEFVGWIEQDAFFVQDWISRVTGWLPSEPVNHPPMMAEKSPARPPQ